VPFGFLVEWTGSFAKKIGSGGFGEVYEGICHSGRTGMRFAVKKLSPELPLETTSEQRDVLRSVDKEISVLQRFRHASIVKLVGFHVPLPPVISKESVSKVCLVYELAARGSLSDLLSSTEDSVKREFDCKKRIRLLSNVASALNHMHCHLPGQPAYHRDVKSSNIALDNEFNPLLIDCGISQFVDNTRSADSIFSTTVGKLSCSPAYACPRYISTGKYDAKCDIYSFGLVMAEVMTGILQGYNDNWFQDIIDEIVPDPLSGEWPEDSFETLKSLAGSCVDKYTRRPADMLTVMRQIDEVEDKYCHRSIDELRLAQEIAELRKQLDALKIQNELMGTVKLVQCLTCYDRVNSSEGIECTNAEESHFCCNKCFRRCVEDQIKSDNRDILTDRQCRIVCNMCLPTLSAYSKKDVHNHCDEATYADYHLLCMGDLCTHVHVAEFDVFVSYRDDSDRELARLIYETLTVDGWKVWLDKNCIGPTVNWRTAFMTGVMASAIIVCILSKGAINHSISANPTQEEQDDVKKRSFPSLTAESECDNVLLEQRLAGEFAQKDWCRIYPLFVGNKDTSTGEYSDFFLDGSYPNSEQMKTMKATVVMNVEMELQDFFNAKNLKISQPNLSVARILRNITDCNGKKIVGNFEAAFREAIDEIEKTLQDKLGRQPRDLSVVR
jgi:serine/threonine protein kinase